MAKKNKTKRQRFAAILLSALMAVAASSFVLAACSQTEDDDDDKTSPSRTDTQTFANANFEYYDDNDGAYRIWTPESWTSGTVSNQNGVSSSSSVARSGIVDTSFDWSEFVDAFNDYEYYSELDEDDPELEDAEYYTDIDNDYDIPGWDTAALAVEDDGDEEDEDAGPSDEAVKAAAKALNPGTHNVAPETEDTDNGTAVLMLHNYRTNDMGTASQYSSSSITLSAGTAAKFSVWVKTADLTYNGGKPVNGNRGAFIRITNTVGGSAQDPLIVRNIDTSDVTANNGWQQYTFYLKASSYASTTFTVVLGLGQQTEGTSTSYFEYVQGYAFFDDLVYEELMASEYETQTRDIPASQKLTLDLSYGADLNKIDAGSVTDNTFALDLDDLDVNGGSELSVADASVAQTQDERGNTYTSYFGSRAEISESEIESDISRSGIRTSAQLRGSSYAALSSDFEKFDDLPFGGANEDILLLYSGNGSPLTATLRAGSADPAFTLGEGEYMYLSFWVKTSDLEGGTGATVTLVDADKKTTLGSIDTTSLATVDLKDDERELEDINDGWQQCFLYLSNTSENGPVTFYLQFSFGVRTINGSALSDYIPGYAAFTGFRYGSMTEEQFGLKTTGTYAVEASLTGGVSNTTYSFDDTAYTQPDKIESDVADPRNYSGVFGGTTYVGGQDLGTVNSLETAGLINREYASNYNDTAWMDCVLSYANALTMTEEIWDAVFGRDCLQPLLIANTAAQAYGYVANASSTLASSSFRTVTVRVKLSPGATANVYLVDTAEKEFGEQQYTDTVNYSAGISYRYDDRGNVINLDPDDPEYSSRTNTVLWKQENGLWAPAADYSGDTYYANLANYRSDDEGNLIDDDDNIVYYASDEDGLYYRYYDADRDKYSLPVRDFTASGEDLTGAVRQQATEKALCRTVTNDGSGISDWIYVRFFLATGNESKNYRLEVWSGSRDGETTNPANSFVAFDVVSYSDLTEDTFTSMLDARMEVLAEELGYADTEELMDAYNEDPAAFIDRSGTQMISYHFSLFDSDQYASYDADYTGSDTDPYGEYDASSYSDTVAYFSTSFKAEGRTYYDTYVDFGASEVTVSTVSSDDSTDDDTTDETTESEQNVWLLVSSILLAAALIATLVILLIKQLLSNMKKKKADKVAPTYDSKRKRYIRKLRLEEAEHDEKADDVLPGEEDEITEEDIYRVDGDTPADDDPDKQN